ncbi:PD-(D/E)XK nuclease family protein [Vibrio cyclitrophicus]|uniref:PDDEXK-like family protein n=1 Tax=Vibrio cyclitrophicus TaxID=47951 RepID=UPI0032E50FFB
MNKELEKIEHLFLSECFSKVASYSSNFDLFMMMGVRSKELVHSNILASLLKPSYPHGLNYAFLNTFTKGVVGLKLTHGKPLSLSTLISATDDNVRVFRELENIDLVVEYSGSQLVLAIENKVWSGEQSRQIARYQKILSSRYPSYKVALIFLTTDGRKSETVDYDSKVPVYCMSYNEIANQLKHVKHLANEPAKNFINQFINHIEGYMSDSSEISELCWQIFNKHEDAYLRMVKAHDYCIQRKVEELFNEMEGRVKTDSIFSDYAGSIVIDKNYEKSKKYIITCDMDIRLSNWPEGLWIKLYKYGWFGVFPYVGSEDRNSVKALSEHLNAYPNKKVRAWDNKYYVSSNNNLDSERMVLSNGNSLSREHVNIALNKLSAHIEEINNALN